MERKRQYSSITTHHQESQSNINHKSTVDRESLTSNTVKSQEGQGRKQNLTEVGRFIKLKSEQKELKTQRLPIKTSASQIHHAKFKVFPDTKLLMLMQLNFSTINLINQCQTCDCNFLLFLIPFCYLLAEVLSYYEGNTLKHLTIYYLFKQIIQKINGIKNSVNPQLPELEITKTITYLLRHDLQTSSAITEKLGLFLKEHGNKMSSFIPVFFSIFAFHAYQKHQFIKSLQTEKSAQHRRALLKEKLAQLEKDCQQYKEEGI